MFKKALLLLLVFILSPGISNAEIKTYIHTVKQSFGGSQSPDDARVGAIAKAKREVLEKAGTYLESLTIVRENVVEKDEILALAAGVLKAEIVSQKNFATKDTFGIIVKAKVDVDTSILEERIRKLLQDRSLLEKYKESQRREKELLVRIERLERKNREFQQSPSTTHKQEKEKLKKDFKEATEGLTATEWVRDALALLKNRKCQDPDRALEYLNQAIHLDPNYVEVYMFRGFALEKKGEYDRAIKNYSRAIELNPKYVEAYYFRGSAWRKKGQYDKAISDYSRAIELNPKYASAYNYRGSTWGKKGEYDKAIIDFNRAIELDPQCAMAYYSRGLALRLKSEYILSISDFNRAIELDPQYAMAYKERGLVWWITGEYVPAISDYNKVIELDPQYAMAYYSRGFVYIELGQNRKAADDLNYYLKLCGDGGEKSDLARQQIKELGYTPKY